MGVVGYYGPNVVSSGNSGGGSNGSGSSDNGSSGGAAPSIDYGYDDSGDFIGEGWGGNPPDDPPTPTFTPVEPTFTPEPTFIPAPAFTPVEPIFTPEPTFTPAAPSVVPPGWIPPNTPPPGFTPVVPPDTPPPIEVWDEEDIDYLDGELVEDLTNEEIAAIVGDPYTPPDEIYGPGIAETGETSYAWEDMDENNATHAGVLNAVNNMRHSASGLNTLEFFGIIQINPYTGKYEWSPNSMNGTQFPVEFINQIAEGSIVSGNEAVETAHLDETGENWPDWIDYYPDGVFNPEGVEVEGDPVDTDVGTWVDVESGEHPMFPEGVDDYYDATDDPFIVPYTGGSSGGGGGGGGWGGWGYGGGRGGSGGGGGYQPQGSRGDAYMRNRWGQSGIQGDWIRGLRGMNRGGIVSLC